MSAALQSLMRETPRPLGEPTVLAGLAQFVAIGASAALGFVLLSTLLINLDTGIADWVIQTACYGAMIVPVYLLHRRFSFRSEAAHRQALPRYLAVQAMALVLAAIFSFVVHGMLALPTMLSSLLVIALTSGLNFVILRSWAFACDRLGAAVTA